MGFMQGIELSRKFFVDLVEPILSNGFPDLRYASALVGPGSEVLGFDTEMSTDHDWGPRVLIFLQVNDIGMAAAIREALESNLPQQFHGYPIDPGQTIITTLAHFVDTKLAYDIEKGPELEDWLTFPSQVLSEIVSGEVFRDDTGQLTRIRAQLQYYPYDIWLYLMASVWNRIGQEEHLALRAGYTGDELGATLIASRLVRDIMNLCFLIERQYAPYPKWFGTAFKKLNCANDLLPLLWSVQSEVTLKARVEALSEAYGYVARMHNRLGITETMNESVSFFYDRPYQVIHGGAFAEAIAKQINGPIMRKLSSMPLIGGIDQITDNTDFRFINQWHGSRQPVERNLIRIIYNNLLK
jgi:hypothetical protein